jgi:hypothetical protein
MSRNGDRMYYLKRMQTFPPVEADLILAQAIKLKMTHIQKYDKLDQKFVEEAKESKSKEEKLETPKKEEKVECIAKKEDKPVESIKQKAESKPIAKLAETSYESSKDIREYKKEEKRPLFEQFKNVSSENIIKGTPKFNPLDMIGNKPLDMECAIGHLNSCISNLKLEEYDGK